MPAWLRAVAGGVLVDVVVQPRASRTRIVGEHGDRLKLQLAAPPVDGVANEALRDYVAEVLEVPRRDVELTAGQTGKRKTLRVAGVSPEEALRRLLPGRQP